MLAACAAPASAAHREHGTHGTVRRLCAPALMRHWPGGPVAARLRAGTDVRRYDLGRRLALGVTQGRRPAARGYVPLSAFCPPSARGRAALEHARVLAARPGRGRPAVTLGQPVARRVCARETWVRDRPLNRAIALAFRGDEVLTDRRGRSAWRGGRVLGHANRRGWVPDSALCHGIARRLPGYHGVAVPGVPGVRVLAPPATPSCSRRIDGRALVQVGARVPGGKGLRVSARLERDGRTVGIVGAAFSGTHGRIGYAALGPPACHRAHAVVYVVRRGTRVLGTAALPLLPGGPPVERAFARGRLTTAFVRAPAATCATAPGRRFAHGGHGAVDHRFHVRPALSASGRWVAFDTPGRLLPGDGDAQRDVYRRDTRTGALVLVSRGGTGGTSRAPAISADGTLVAFESDTAGLVAGDDDRVRDVFLADVRTGALRRLSRDAPARTPALSADGGTVAYESAGGLVVQDTRSGRVERRIPGAFRPSLTRDGALVAYETRARVGAADANGDWDVAVARVAGGAPRLVSQTPAGRAPRGTSLAPSLSADGTRVAFQSDAPGLVAGDRNGLRDVFVRDLTTGRIVRVSDDRCGGDADGYSRYPALSADGRRVAFDSHASDLVAGDTGGRGHVYVAEVVAGTHARLVDTRPGGAPSARTAFSPALSADGLTVAFPTFGYDLGPRDADHRVDVYTRRLPGGRARRAG